MADTPFPTYTGDIGANVVNTIGWAFEALNPMTWLGGSPVGDTSETRAPRKTGYPWISGLGAYDTQAAPSRAGGFSVLGFAVPLIVAGGVAAYLILQKGR